MGAPTGRRTSGVIQPVGGEQHLRMTETLEFEVIARRVANKARALLATTAGKARVRVYSVIDAVGLQARQQRVEVIPGQHQAEVRRGYLLIVHRVGRDHGHVALLYLVYHQLVTAEIVVYPVRRRTTAPTAEHVAVENGCGVEIVHRQGKMKNTALHGSGSDFLTTACLAPAVASGRRDSVPTDRAIDGAENAVQRCLYYIVTDAGTTVARAINIELYVADRFGVGTLTQCVLAVFHKHQLPAGKALHRIHKSGDHA